MPVRVSILCEYPTLNGGERSLLACIESLSADDVQPLFLAPSRGPLAEELQRRSLRHVAFDLHGVHGKLTRDAAIERLIANCRDGCDVLHANSLAMGRLTGAAAARLGIPCTAHLRDILKLSAAVVADLNGNVQLVAVSQAVRDFHIAQGVAAERVAVIYNGIDGSEFRPQLRTGELRRELGLPEATFLVAAIGQICLRKGQDVFAAVAVLAARSLPGAHFLLIGSRHSTKRESAAFESAIAARFARSGLGDRFHSLGERSGMATLLTEIDVLVHAARQEPFGRVLLEAAAAGGPIIATDVGGTSEMLCDGEHALLVRPDDAPAIAEALVRLTNDTELAARLGTAARERVVELFGIDRSASALLDVWKAAAVRRY